MKRPEAPISSDAPSQLKRLVTRLFQRLIKAEASGGMWLIAAAAVALIWSNSPWAATYEQILHHPIGLGSGPLAFERSLEWFINDGLMVLFFFVVGLEIRLEMHAGELSDWRRASLPTVAALGGMAVPALIYIVFAGAAPTRSGWGVPTATDIAFAVGVLALLGKRVPGPLRILLLALAVIDDVGAILIIALFYSSGIALGGVLTALLGLGGILLLQRLGVRSKAIYVLPALVTWAGTYSAGVHPTIAGVVIGLMTPVRGAGDGPSPAADLVERLHPWVTFGVMPIFALANAGVALGSVQLSHDSAPIALGIGLGLVLGKPIGVVGASLIALKLGFARLPNAITVRHLIIVGFVAGIGFTMSLFVAQLAFDNPAYLNIARLSIVTASAVAAGLSLGLGYTLLPAQRRERTAEYTASTTSRPSTT